MTTSQSIFATSSTVSSDGTSITYRTAGAADARPLVLVHGWAQSSQSWGFELLSELAQHYRVVALDMRGHGLSDVAEKGYDDPRQWADDVAAVLDSAGIGEGSGALLLGWSYGGAVAADYVAHHGEAALGGVVLVGAVTGLSRSPGAAAGPAMKKVLTEGGLDADPAKATAAFAEFGEGLWHGGDDVDRQRTLGISLATPPQVRKALFGQKVDNDETLKGMTTPALIVHGARDEVVPPETGRANAETIPDSTYVEFAESAHVPFLEQRAEFVAALAEFAGRLSPA